MEKINYDGHKFGRLIVLRDGNGLFEGKKKRRSVICRCDCGVEKEVMLRYLTDGDTKSCGCLKKEQCLSVNKGDTFGFWTVLGEGVGYRYKGKKTRTLKVQCICGKERGVSSSILHTRKSNSCGCKGRPQKIKKEKLIPQDTEDEQWKHSDKYTNYYFSSLGRVFNYNRQSYWKNSRNAIKYEVNKEFNITKEIVRLFIGEYCEKSHYILFLDGDQSNKRVSNMFLSVKTYDNVNWLTRVMNNMRSSDKKNDITVKDVIEQYEKQEGLSYFLKLPMDLTMKDKLRAISIDRIDNSKGYIKGNFTLVTRFENMGRNSNTFEDMIEFCNSNFSILK